MATAKKTTRTVKTPAKTPAKAPARKPATRPASAAKKTPPASHATVTIDGRDATFVPGQTILDVAAENDIAIPTLCYLPRTGHRDVCRICVVEVAGAGRLLAACSTPATAGMVVATASERVMDSRRMTLAMLLGSGRHTCITCDALGVCELSKLSYEYGVEAPASLPEGDYPRVEDTYVVRDYSKCILCGRCWSACAAIQVHGVVPHPSGRRAERHGGLDWYPLPDVEHCDFCGSCVDACPVGALTERRARGVARQWEMDSIRTTCPHCGMGCQTVVHVKDGEVVKVTGAGDAPPNRGRLCRRGRFAVYEPDARERLAAPLLRRSRRAKLAPVAWEEALDTVAQRLTAIIETHGPDAVAGLVSPARSNEDAYQAQKFFRAVVGSDSIDHRSPTASLLPLIDPGAAGAGCYTAGALAVLEEARAILVVGDGDIDDYPVAGAAVRGAVREGATLIVVDAGHNVLGEIAATRISVDPPGIAGVLSGVASLLLAGELAGRGASGELIPHQRELQSLLVGLLPERVAAAAGVDAATLRSIAETLTGVQPAVVVAALGDADDVTATWNGVVQLQTLLDDIAGARSLALPHATGNAQGLVDMGVVPGLLPGHVAGDAEGRARFAAAWGVADLPAGPGRSTAGILEGLESGAVRAVWIAAQDADQFGDRDRLLAALAKADLVIAQSAVRGDLAEGADIVLPAVSWGEEDGTFINAERRVSRVRAVRRPLAEARPGWWIFREVAKRLGHEWPAFGARAIWDTEIAALAPGLDGVTYDDLEQWGLCWHIPSAEERAALAAG
jgi:predicted molibdopterin-dependent oxidoreductase YjgC